jgi:predicted ATPase/DNA-binding winged helix-turn-helix (wHTH) protein
MLRGQNVGDQNGRAPMESSGIAPAHSRRLSFDRFCLLPAQRVLLQGDTPIRIGARALDILVALASRPGELVTKDELITQVWPNTFVDPTNLRVNIAALRKALGDSGGRLISNDPGRGYRFTVDVRDTASAAQPASGVAPDVCQLPRAMSRLIGRSEFVSALAEQLPRRRQVTVVGPGGIGKTRVAIACAEALAGSYRDGVHFVDLATVLEPASIAAAVAEVLEMAVGPDDPLRDLLRLLTGRELLLVFDNCEHVVQAAAGVVEAIASRAPGVHILATSRESLRSAGEWVRILPPLPSPPDTPNLSAAEALRYPAVELFVERAAAAGDGFQLADADAPAVGEICRRLDGVALAIELAAAQADVFGVAWLAAHLDDRLWMLNRGPRTAVPRHQTLSALLDWSYMLLSEQEQATLRRVAMFPGEFTLADAIAVAADQGVGDTEAVSAVVGLVSKSLAMADVSGPVTRYRLPETTRAYAFSKAPMSQSALRCAEMPAMM